MPQASRRHVARVAYMIMRAICISTGTELLLGRAVDTNSAWLSGQLAELGLPVIMHQTIGDETDAIAQQISAIEDILECHHVTGEHNFFLKVKTQNTESLEKLIRRLRSISGITQTHTSVVFSTPFERALLSV